MQNNYLQLVMSFGNRSFEDDFLLVKEWMVVLIRNLCEGEKGVFIQEKLKGWEIS